MPRKTFVSKEFFVNARPEDVRLTLLALPQFIEDIKFVHENALLSTVRFLYQNKADQNLYRVDVSVLPLNDEYTQVNLHLSYANEQAFYKDASIRQELLHFEEAIQAALKGDHAFFAKQPEKAEATKRWRPQNFIASLEWLLLRKRAV